MGSPPSAIQKYYNLRKEYLSVGGLDSLTSSIEVPGLGCSCVAAGENLVGEEM
jgi:hypothetical protein